MSRLCLDFISISLISCTSISLKIEINMNFKLLLRIRQQSHQIINLSHLFLLIHTYRHL